MKNREYSNALRHLMTILILLFSASCSSFSENMTKATNDSMYEDNWLAKYFYNVLYVGMSEEDFVKLFTKNSDWSDPDRPYIKKHYDNYYIASGLNTSYVPDCRIVFRNGFLFKYESFGWGKIPLLDSGYTDYTYLLKGGRR